MIDLGAINSAIAAGKRLGEIAKKINNAEITNIAAEMMLELAEAKMALAAMKTEHQQLLEENEALKKERSVTYSDNKQAFKFEASDTWLCTTCYANGKTKMPLQLDGTMLTCPTCHVFPPFPKGIPAE